MKLVANRVNGVHLRDILPAVSGEVQVDRVLAAIAYGSSASDETKDLVGSSVSIGVRLDLWMRYDHTVPVSVELLERLLESQSSNVFTRFIPDSFHPKVIWWKGYGAYIGSANHTDRGWLTNIEVGVFLGEDELVANGMDVELDGFFDYLKDIDVSIPISEDLIKEMRVLAKANSVLRHFMWIWPDRTGGPPGCQLGRSWQ
ncbi:phospholipase D family protein [Halomonas mongoliensis]|uniref:phospholipase D family protein n=1 Tax=Halomonas mongoliensis TaxID=321265 RepID=UPI00403AF984